MFFLKDTDGPDFLRVEECASLRRGGLVAQDLTLKEAVIVSRVQLSRGPTREHPVERRISDFDVVLSLLSSLTL